MGTLPVAVLPSMVDCVGRMGYAPLACTVAFTVVGQIAVKFEMIRVGGLPTETAERPAFFLRAVTSPHVIVGPVLGGVAAPCRMGTVSEMDLGMATPFMSPGTRPRAGGVWDSAWRARVVDQVGGRGHRLPGHSGGVEVGI